MLWHKMGWLVSVVIATLSMQETWAARVALVIGNAAYTESPLRNPVNDARAMAAKLKDLKFEVIVRENLKAKQIGATLQAFQSRIKPGDEALFFYAGHGLQVKGVNYLPAVDAEINSELDVPQQSINVGTVLDLLEESKAGVKLVFLDACRNNPYARSFRSSATGLSKVGNAPTGTLISFATRPGSVAADGAGQNGLYTEVLLRHIATPNQPIEQMLKKVASGVEQTSQGKQEPWIEGSIKGDFYFITGPVTIVQQNTTSPSLDPETEAWNAAKESNSIVAVELYLQEYRQGKYVTAAKILLAKLKEQGGVNRPTTNTNNSNTNYTTTTTQTVSYRAKQEFKDCDVCPSMVVIAPGSFVMGSPSSESEHKANEEPQHSVSINYSFAVGKFEVTFAEWDACVAAGGCTHRPDDAGWGRGTRPVINVNWDDAQSYVRWLQQKTKKPYRLLNEAEWEYVARAGTTTPFTLGSTINTDQANFDGNYTYNGSSKGSYRQKTVPVGSFSANPFGLYDLAGNVWEWVQDCYQADFKNAPTDGSAIDSNNCSARAFRGGSWDSTPVGLRSAYRYSYPPDKRYTILGFRIARNLP